MMSFEDRNIALQNPAFAMKSDMKQHSLLNEIYKEPSLISYKRERPLRDILVQGVLI